MNFIKKFSLFALGIAFVAFGCEREDVQPSDPSRPAPKSFKVRMTDSPGDYEALDVEILKVEAYLEGEGWVSLNNDAQFVSVLELTNGAETTLAEQFEGEAQAGVYSKLKFTFGSENHLEVSEALALELGPIALNSNGMLDLSFGSGEQEVIIEIDEEVSAEAGADLLIDFNVAQSIYQEADSFFIQPALEEIENAETGVRGQVSGAVSAMVMIYNDSDTASTFIDAQGNFLLRGMTSGSYDLMAIPNRVEGELQDPEPYEIDGVLITEGEISTVGNISF